MNLDEYDEPNRKPRARNADIQGELAAMRHSIESLEDAIRVLTQRVEGW